MNELGMMNYGTVIDERDAKRVIEAGARIMMNGCRRVGKDRLTIIISDLQNHVDYPEDHFVITGHHMSETGEDRVTINDVLYGLNYCVSILESEMDHEKRRELRKKSVRQLIGLLIEEEMAEDVLELALEHSRSKDIDPEEMEENRAVVDMFDEMIKGTVADIKRGRTQDDEESGLMASKAIQFLQEAAYPPEENSEDSIGNLKIEKKRAQA
jgi:hypothetical protein